MNGVVHGHPEAGNRLFVAVWVYLLAITALELVLAYIKLFPTGVMLAVLMALSFVKAALIVAYFMHLRFEKVAFVLSLVPGVVIVMSLLLAFFPDSFRVFQLHVP